MTTEYLGSYVLKYFCATFHLPEVVNIIETRIGLEKSPGFLALVITSENIKVCSVLLFVQDQGER